MSNIGKPLREIEVPRLAPEPDDQPEPIIEEPAWPERKPVPA